MNAKLKHMVAAYLAGSMAMLLVDFPNHFDCSVSDIGSGKAAH